MTTEYEQLCQEILACTHCPLHRSRRQAVPGDGPPTAEIVFVGEAPGYHEDRQGKPFVGPAGQLLNELLQSAGLRREEVYITNVVKCRPPENRDPAATEIAACDPYLDRQLGLINPKVVVTLGRYSAAKFFPGQSISKIRGKPKRIGGRVYFPMFHPAAALHQPRYRQALEEDIQKIPKLLAEARLIEAEPTLEEPQQMRFFLD